MMSKPINNKYDLLNCKQALQLSKSLYNTDVPLLLKLSNFNVLLLSVYKNITYNVLLPTIFFGELH